MAEKRSLEQKALERSKPAVLRMRKDIYISMDQCLDCKAFQELAKEMAGIKLNTVFFPCTKTGPIVEGTRLAVSPYFIRFLRRTGD